MSTRGFAVIGVVWLLVILIGAAGMTVASVQIGLNRSRNRLRLTRAEWARDACAEILLGRYRQLPEPRPTNPDRLGLDTIDLGRETWCVARVEDPGARVNLNVADSGALMRFVGDSQLVHRILARRPLDAVDQLLRNPGIDGSTERILDQFATVRGTGRVNLNTASAEVLRAVINLDSASVDAILGRRQRGEVISDPASISYGRSPGATGSLQDALAQVSVAPEQVVAQVVGGVTGSPLRSHVTLTLALLPDRLAVLRREAE